MTSIEGDGLAQAVSLEAADEMLATGLGVAEVAARCVEQAERDGWYGDLRDLVEQKRGIDGLKILTEAFAAPLFPPRGPAEWREAGWVPLGEMYAHPDLDRSTDFDLYPVTAVNHLSLVCSPPKTGKSTFKAHYVDAKATGGEFLGQPIERGRALIVAPDENWRLMARRLGGLGTPGEMIDVWTAPEFPIDRIAALVRERGHDLVVLDTLSRVAGVRDENDNGEWTRWFGDADPHIRESGAVWLASHHDRKGGGKAGDGIRGASAIFGCVDIAFSLSRVDGHQDRRLLRLEGTRLEQTDDLIIELTDGRYRVSGPPQAVAVGDDPELAKVREVLGDTPTPIRDVAELLGIEYQTAQRRLEKLCAAGLARRVGLGGRSDPFRYHSAVPQGRGPERRNEAGSEVPDRGSGTTERDPQAIAEREDTCSAQQHSDMIPPEPSGRRSERYEVAV